MDEGFETLVGRIQNDDDFVATHKLEGLRETFSLDYSSYILALTMGAGKTALIGAIVATEFAMHLEYPDQAFVGNALVFAPGKTIFSALHELYETPYDLVLPPPIFRNFMANLKITFTRDGEKDIPVAANSLYNLIVTNTEKIRIQKETIRRRDIGALFEMDGTEDAKQEVANLRLQTLASLPQLGVFSDEAHHTYGQSLDSELKKVRRTVDYLNERTNVVCVVNTTGTPYFGKQLLRDVVVWYGLAQAIQDGILKELTNGIRSYELGGDTSEFIRQVLTDFFEDYGELRLPNGAPAKIAMYFPQPEDIAEYRQVVEATIQACGYDPSIVLVNTSNAAITTSADQDSFERLNDPDARHRVVLLVNKGTEGWNCPSLFATALARKLKHSNNFVLQAACRCLRQVPGNTQPARVYLSHENKPILDKQLQETFGESIEDLNRGSADRLTVRVVLRKPDLPPLKLKRTIRRVLRVPLSPTDLILTPPPTPSASAAVVRTYTPHAHVSTVSVLEEVEERQLVVESMDLSTYTAAVSLAQTYRLSSLTILNLLADAYPNRRVPASHMSGLADQIEAWSSSYTVEEEEIEVALAIVKRDGFDHDEDSGTFYTQIVYPKAKADLLLTQSDAIDQNGLGFHLDPYYFDSRPELNAYEQLLRMVSIDPEDVSHVLFTGGTTDPAKSDLFIEYQDLHDRWRRYFPDLLIMTKVGRMTMIEIKAERSRNDPIEGEQGEKARRAREFRDLNPREIQYEMLFTQSDTVAANLIREVLALAISEGH